MRAWERPSAAAFDLRLAATVCGLAILPMLSFIGLQAAFSFQSERMEAEAGALRRAESILAIIESRLERTRGVAAALATSPTIAEEKWSEAYARAKEITDQNPDWSSTVLWRRDDRREVFDTSRAESGAAREVTFAPPRLVPGAVSIGGIIPAGEHCPCVLAHSLAGPGGDYVLTVRLDLAPFQQLLLRAAEPTGVTSLVDRPGHVIARSKNYALRVGQPASDVPRMASRAGSGIYRGRTAEGFDNYSAYVTSPQTGWSVHYAFAPAVLDVPRFKRVGATFAASAVGLLVSGSLAWLMFRYFRSRRELEEQRVGAERAEAARQLGFARDLHDGTLQFLTGAGLKLEVIRRGLSAESTQAKALEALQNEIRREQLELRRFIEGLVPGVRRPDSEQSLQDLADQLSRRWEVKILVSPAGADALVPSGAKRDVELILREAVANAARHGEAHEIKVEIARDDEELILSIDDDGVGLPEHGDFDHSRLSTHPGRPRSIVGRVEQLGGKVRLFSDIGGVRLVIRLPLDQEAYAASHR